MKEKITVMIAIFTRVVSMIFAVSSIYIAAFFGTSGVLRVKDVWAILLIGAVSAVCYVPILNERECSKRRMLLLQAAYFLIINVTSVALGFALGWLNIRNPLITVCFEAVVLVVYAVVMAVSYKLDSDSAKKMNERLREREA